MNAKFSIALATLLSLLSFWLGAAQNAWADERLEEIESFLSRVHAEEDLIHRTVRDDATSGEQEIRAFALFPAPRDRVWQELKRFAELGKGTGILNVSQILPLNDHDREVIYAVELPWPIKKMNCGVRFQDEPEEYLLRWDQSTSCVKANKGSIHLREVAQGTLFEMTVHLELGDLLPKWLVSWAMGKKLSAEIQRLRKTIAL